MSLFRWTPFTVLIQNFFVLGLFYFEKNVVGVDSDSAGEDQKLLNELEYSLTGKVLSTLGMTDSFWLRLLQKRTGTWPK